MSRHIRRILRDKRALVATAVLIVSAACAFYYVHNTEPTFAPNGYYLDRVGPLRAQDVALELKRQGLLAVNGHDYLHEVGEYIYDHYGPEGAGLCRPYFDHACYNGLTLHMTSLADIAEVVAACNKVDLGTMLGCIHGGGHAALFMSNYDIPEALQLCDELAAPYPDTGALRGCAFGVFMENAEPHLVSITSTSSPWATSPWHTSQTDPMYPCDSPRVGAQYLSGCWRQQGVVVAMHYQPAQAVPVCLSLSDSSYISSCFIGLLDQYGAGDFSKAKADAICDIATGRWRDSCLLDAVDRAFMNGYDPSLGTSICKGVSAASSSDCAALVARDSTRYQ